MFREWIGRFISGTIIILYVVVGFFRKNKEFTIYLQIQLSYMNDHNMLKGINKPVMLDQMTGLFMPFFANNNWLKGCEQN